MTSLSIGILLLVSTNVVITIIVSLHPIQFKGLGSGRFKKKKIIERNKKIQ